jgi:hypothetical protein
MTFVADVDEHMLIRVLSSRISLPVFFNTISGIAIAKPIYREHIGILFVHKKRVYSYFILHTYCSMI